MRSFLGFSLMCGVLAVSAAAQTPTQPASPTTPSSSSSSSTPTTVQEPTGPTVHPGGGLAEAGGAQITLETSEALFDVATALNACGYDSDLAESNPVRAAVRADVAASVADSAKARESEDALCKYIGEHELTDKGRELAQYISLALYLTPPPQLTTIADQTEMPPDSLQVVNILPLLRSFAESIDLHAIWLKHHAEYEAITARLHEPVTQLVFGTNVYLKIPVSSYSDRRLLILVEPMLAPNAPNARIYATDYVVVTSPTASGAVRMDQIRHLYLHYTIEPLVYARANSMLRLTPLLKPVEDAPLEYIYKTDVVALVTECLIKAIEARRMDTGLPMPQKPTGTRARADLARYDEEMASYERQSEEMRRKQVDLDMRQGWTMTLYFYERLLELERNPEGLDESMGQMVYGMDVDRERHRDEQIAFLPVGSGEFVRRAPKAPTGMMLAEKMMLEGHLDEADAIADKALADPKGDHAGAMFVKARVDLIRHDPESSFAEFELVLKTAKDPRTQAWAHIYLGRLNDIKEPAERAAAVTEYKAALTVPGVPQDARAAADSGLKVPFTVPKVKHEEEEPLDPSGKAEKDAYKPPSR
jgi:hypothetical protein